MIVFSEYSPQLPDSASLRDLARGTEAARFAGAQVYSIPQDLPEGVSADDALWHVPIQTQETVGIWIGYIPLVEHYEQIYQAALSRNIRLVNSPEEFCRGEEFDQFYPFIADLTVESVCADSLAACEVAALSMGYPVFLKGSVQSLKADGIGSCIANGPEELRLIAGRILAGRRRSLGKVIVRRVMQLRSARKGPGSFPLGREFRVFIYRGRVVGFGYYWEGEDELAPLLPDERKQVLELAMEAARRLDVPYLSVDVGQLSNGDWIVIELGDGQFSGLSQTPIHHLWANLLEIVHEQESGV